MHIKLYAVDMKRYELYAADIYENIYNLRNVHFSVETVFVWTSTTGFSSKYAEILQKGRKRYPYKSPFTRTNREPQKLAPHPSLKKQSRKNAKRITVEFQENCFKRINVQLTNVKNSQLHASDLSMTRKLQLHGYTLHMAAYNTM